MINGSAYTASLPKNTVCGKSVCHYPSYPIGRRLAHLTIHPRDVIKGWVLCQHLGWGVHSIAFATCYNPLLNQTSREQARLRLVYLEQAEYYLARELNRFPRCTLIPIEPYSLTTKQVIRDWKLSFHLGETLFYLKTSLSSYRRKEALERALKHLREEILITRAACKLYDPKAEVNNIQDLQINRSFLNKAEINHG